MQLIAMNRFHKSLLFKGLNKDVINIIDKYLSRYDYYFSLGVWIFNKKFTYTIENKMVYCAKMNYFNLFKYYCSRGFNICDQPSIFASVNGNLEMLIYIFNKTGTLAYPCLHNAVIYNHIDIVEYLMDKNQTININTAICLIRNNKYDMFVFCFDNKLFSNLSINELEFLMTESARYNCIEIMKYLHSKNVPYLLLTMQHAIIAGHLNIVQYLNEYNLYDTDSCAYAAYYNHLEILKYIIDKAPYNNDLILSSNCYDIDIIRFLMSKGCIIDESVADNISRQGNLESMMYMLTKFNWTKQMSINVIKYNKNIELIEYMVQNKYYIDDELLSLVIARGDLKIIKLFHNSGYRFVDPYREYIRSQPLEIVQFLINHYPVSKDDCDCAVLYRSIDKLKILHKYKKSTSLSCKLAVSRKDLELLKYLIESKQPYKINQLCCIAIHKNDLEILKYLINTGRKYDKKKLYRCTARTSNYRIMQFLNEL